MKRSQFTIDKQRTETLSVRASGGALPLRHSHNERLWNALTEADGYAAERRSSQLISSGLSVERTADNLNAQIFAARFAKRPKHIDPVPLLVFRITEISIGRW